jgi:segregation and condensation protein B
MNEQYVKNVIEAALLAAGRPLSADELIAVFDQRDGSSTDEVRTALATLREEYSSRGLELIEVASGFRIQIRASVAEPVSRLWVERPAKYSRAMLETLALVAYRQPITRGEIEQIRGVVVNPNIIKTMLERSWIRVVGHRDVPGRPELLGTTREFLDYFGLKKLDDLPTLAQLKELEDLRVQLALPGAEPAVAAIAPESAEVADGADSAGAAGATEAAGGAQADANAALTDNEDDDDDEADAGNAEPHARDAQTAGPEGTAADDPELQAQEMVALGAPERNL